MNMPRCYNICHFLDAYPRRSCGQSPQEQLEVKCLPQGHSWRWASLISGQYVSNNLADDKQINPKTNKFLGRCSNNHIQMLKSLGNIREMYHSQTKLKSEVLTLNLLFTRATLLQHYNNNMEQSRQHWHVKRIKENAYKILKNWKMNQVEKRREAGKMKGGEWWKARAAILTWIDIKE